MIARLLGAAALAGFLCAGVQTRRLGILEDEVQAQALLASQELAAAEKQARAQEQEWADSTRKAAQTYAAQTARLRADSVGARDELGRLRDALSSGGVYAAEGAASAARADDATRARIVADECATALVQVAQAADDAEARLVALQRYVAGITQER